MATWTIHEAANEILAVLPYLNRMIVAELQNEAGQETTMIQFRVLSHLAEQPLTLSVLAKKRRVSLQAAGELVQALVTRGWIIREPDPLDRRQSLLKLTEEGQRRYERAQRRMVDHLAPLLETLTVEEMNAIQKALPALHRALSREDDLEEA